MGRWEPDARGRLGAAAMELYVERGYEQTTVADIAARAGVTPRTFFRHFADKPEVLFDGSDALTELLTGAVAGAPKDAGALDAVAGGLDAVAARIGTDREYSRRRQQVISSTPELLERELMKLAHWSTALGDALRARGVRDPRAALAAETGVAVFRVAFERWLAGGSRPLRRVLRDAFEQLRTLTA